MINNFRIRRLGVTFTHSTVTKKAAASWVKSEFGSQWNTLIQTAENWSYGQEMDLKEETIDFIQFVVNKIKEI
ncbi:MAG: DUF4111 domain-containing protein [Proteobacteria bacterium]|nr:DUF4111 domain-containing protein [Pseudomonadota bacterium]